MRRIVITYGLIAGGILSAMLALSTPFMDRIGLDGGAMIGYTSMVLAFLMIWFGVRSYRDHVAGGRLGFGRAFAVGLGITLVASACHVATWQVIYYRFAPDFADRYAAHAIDKARRDGATEAEIAEKTREMEDFKTMYRNPLINIALTLIEPLPVGLIFTLVTAGVVSRRRPEPAPEVA